VKLSNSGNLQWQKCFGGTGSDEAKSIQQTSDGNYIIAGYSESTDGDVTGNHSIFEDYWVIKINIIGIIQWQKSYGGTVSERSNSIQQTTDGGYIIAGYSSSNDGDVTGNHGNLDYWVVKLNNTVGIEDNIIKNSILIFPNPSNGQFNFSGLQKESSIEIYDVSGRLIYTTISQNNSESINLSEKEKEIYL